MNRYTTARLLAAARDEGRRVLVVSANAQGTRSAFEEMVPLVDCDARVRRVNGGERIEYLSGGGFFFTSIRSMGHRGVAVDTVLIDRSVPLSPQLFDLLTTSIAASPTGEIVFA